jgi:hypothetical protein
MNQRIQELLKQAGVGDNWNKADWYSMSPEMIEKFAELIVLECSSICYKGLENGDEAASLLMNTFGVEE